MFFALDDLSHPSGAYGETMRIAGGHLIHLFGVRSEYLSVLEQLFRFCRESLGR